MRVRSTFWENAKVLGKNGVLEVRNVDGRPHVARKERRSDEWDPPNGRGTTEETTLVVNRDIDRKMRVTSRH